MTSQHYLSYEDILKRIELLNEQYELNDRYFASITDQLLASERSADEIIMDGFQQFLQQVNEEMSNMEQFMDVKASCFMGCAFCCYFPIIITELEAKTMKRIIDHWPAERKQRIMDHLEKWQANYKEEIEHVTSIDHENDPEFKKKYIASQVPCPMLDTESNMCMAYEIRPIPCRTYVNYADPKVCADNYMPKETISYEFLYDFYMGSLNEVLQELYEDGEEMFVDYPSDVWNYDYLANWAKEWLKEEQQK